MTPTEAETIQEAIAFLQWIKKDVLDDEDTSIEIDTLCQKLRLIVKEYR